MNEKRDSSENPSTATKLPRQTRVVISTKFLKSWRAFRILDPYDLLSHYLFQVNRIRKKWRNNIKLDINLTTCNTIVSHLLLSKIFCKSNMHCKKQCLDTTSLHWGHTNLINYMWKLLYPFQYHGMIIPILIYTHLLIANWIPQPRWTPGW